MQDYSSLRFLIVDDFSDFRGSLKSMLRDLGAQDIDTAERGEEALAMCRNKRYDVILHDYNLGAGKNGQQVLEELLAGQLISHQSIFIMVTAESSQAMVLGALEHEPDSYLTKPFNRASLEQRLNKLRERKTLLAPVLKALDKKAPAEVLSACEQLLAQDKRLVPLCQRYKAEALRALGRILELDKLLTEVLSVRSVPWACVMQGHLLLLRGDLAKARSTFEQALKTFPMLPALYDGLSATLEAQGDTERAQKVLQEAVRLSPLAIHRQTQLGQLALENQDFAEAAKAFRSAKDQGHNSRFKNPESYLGLSQALLNQVGSGDLDKRAQQEIAQSLTELGEHFAQDAGLQVRSTLLKAGAAQHSSNPQLAKQLAQQACAELAELQQGLSAKALLSMVKQFNQLGETEAGLNLLRSCAETYGDDEQVLGQIAQLTDDPQIIGTSQQATELNRQGVRSYQTGQFDEALALFSKAQKLQPKNISIALNRAQSLLRKASLTEDDKQQCQECLNVAGKMPENDSRYLRYQQLRQRAESL